MFLQENDVLNEKVVLSKKQLPAQWWPAFHSLVNVVQIHLRQHCTRKLLEQCWPRPHTHLFAGKQPAKQPYTILRWSARNITKKITCAIMTHSPETTLHRKIIYNFFWTAGSISLGQHYQWNVGPWLRAETTFMRKITSRLQSCVDHGLTTLHSNIV